MDKRGLTTDPMMGACEGPKWYTSLGPSQKPSPYATASWSYYQQYEVTYQEEDCGEMARIAFDDGGSFNSWVENAIEDGWKLDKTAIRTTSPGIFQSPPTAPTNIKHIFASVQVYDSKASSPGVESGLDVSVGYLLIDSDEKPVEIRPELDPAQFVTFDNGDNFQNPVPNTDPRATFDGGLIPQGTGYVVLEGAEYEVIDGRQILVGKATIEVFKDGSLLEADGDPDGGKYIEATRTAQPSDNVSPGDLLGELNYEIIDCVVYITDWSHYNWGDATPVRKAFEAMVNGLPFDIGQVRVDDTPNAFWTSLGFVRENKGSTTLVYSDPKKTQPY